MKSIKFGILIVCIFIASSGQALHSAAQTQFSPFKISPFVVPDSLKTLVGGYRANWTRLTGFEYSGLHWGQFVLIFTNDGEIIYRNNYLAFLANYLSEEDEDEGEHKNTFIAYKKGTVFVKENYLSDKGHPTLPISLTIMIKREKGYDVGFGDWEYVMSDKKGSIILRGNSNNRKVFETCLECHQNMVERDYVFATFYTDTN